MSSLDDTSKALMIQIAQAATLEALAGAERAVDRDLPPDLMSTVTTTARKALGEMLAEKTWLLITEVGKSAAQDKSAPPSK